MAYAQKNKSKAGGWNCMKESREQARNRRNATKATALKRKKQLKLRAAKEADRRTPEKDAARAEKAKAAARKVFEAWLQTPEVNEFVVEPRRYYDLVYWLRGALKDVLPEKE